MAITIGGPVGVNSRGHPHVSIFRIRAPGAVVVQVLVADDVGRDVTRRSRVIVVSLAFVAPVVKVIAITGLVNIRLQVISSGESAALP